MIDIVTNISMYSDQYFMNNIYEIAYWTTIMSLDTVQEPHPLKKSEELIL